MTALEIKTTKSFMNSLLVSSQFEQFLVEEAVITTFNTFTIDGHIVREFYTAEELESLEADKKALEFSSWQEIRPVCFSLIKGKKTPVSFKAVLHAPLELIEKIAANPQCGVAANLIRSLVLNIRYDNGKVTCVTASAFTTFVMDKSVDKLWDAYVKSMFSEFGLDFEEV
jgi:hypothetical protein